MQNKTTSFRDIFNWKRRKCNVIKMVNEYLDYNIK